MILKKINLFLKDKIVVFPVFHIFPQSFTLHIKLFDFCLMVNQI